MNLDQYKGLPAKAREYLDRQALAYEPQNDFWKTYNQNEAKRQAAGRHPDHHLRRRDQQGVRRQGEGDRLGERDQGEPAVRRAAEEGAGKVEWQSAGDSAYGRLLEVLALAGCALMLRHDADDLRRRVPAQRAHRAGDGGPRLGERDLGGACSTSSPCSPRPGCCAAASTSASTSCCARCRSASAGCSSGWSTRSALACCCVIAWYGARAALGELQGRLDVDQDADHAGVVAAQRRCRSRSSLLAVEMLFRMRRLLLARARAAR